MTADLSAFLLARVAEDEAAARAAIDPEMPGTTWQWVRPADDVPVEDPTEDDMPVSLRTVEEFPTTSGVIDIPAFVLWSVDDALPGACAHIARHDPARVLAQCAALRAVVQMHREDREHHCPTANGSDYYGRYFGWAEEAEHPQRCGTLRTLAAAYADHPDYREEWRA